MNKKVLGDFGEKLACKYLKKHNYKILQRNYTNKLGEIDIICFDKTKNMLVFVEVKYKTDDFFGLPREMVTETKQKKIQDVASVYLMQQKMTENDFRFDVVEVLGNKIEHFENAF